MMNARSQVKSWPLSVDSALFNAENSLTKFEERPPVRVAYLVGHLNGMHCLVLEMQKCAEKTLSEMPQTYFTFARTLPPSSKISKSVLALLKKFSWNKLIIIVGKRNEWIQIKDAVMDLARIKNIDVTDVIQIDDYIPSQMETINKIALDTYKRTRGAFLSN